MKLIKNRSVLERLNPINSQFKSEQDINYFGIGGFFKNLAKELISDPKVTDSVVSKEVSNVGKSMLPDFLDQALSKDLSVNVFPSGFNYQEQQLLKEYRKTFLDAKLGDSDWVSTATKLDKDIARTFGRNSAARDYIYAPISDDVRKLFTAHDINKLPNAQAKKQRAANVINNSREFDTISSRSVKNLSKDSNIIIFPKPVTIDQLKNDIYRKYYREFEDLTGIKLSKDEVMNLAEATDRFQDVARLEKEMSRLGSKNYTIYGAVSNYGSDYSGFILGTTKMNKDNPAIKLMQEQIKNLRGTTISGDELNKLEDAVVNSVPKNKTYLYSSDNPSSNIGGYYHVDTGLSFVNTRVSTADELNSTTIHEGLSHATDELLPQNVKQAYQDIISALQLHPSIQDSTKWQELRATLNQLKNKLAPDGNLETLRNKLSTLDPHDLADLLEDINGYGQDYRINLLYTPGINEKASLLKKALLTLPASALAVLLGTQVVKSETQSDEALKAQEGAKLPETFIINEEPELDYNEPEFIFRHLKDEYQAQDFDNDLNDFYYRGQITNGELSEKAKHKLQRDYNLNNIELNETFDDLYTAGLAKALTLDLEEPEEGNDTLTYKTGGRLIPKASGGRELVNVLYDFGNKLLKNMSGGTQVLSKRVPKKTKNALEAVITSDPKVNKYYQEGMPIPDNLIKELQDSDEARSFYKQATKYSEDKINLATSQNKEFSEELVNRIDSQAKVPYTGGGNASHTFDFVPNSLVESYDKLKKLKKDDRIDLIVDTLKEAKKNNITLPEEYISYLKNIIKVPKVSSQKELGKFGTVSSKDLDLLDFNPLNEEFNFDKKLDLAVSSLKSIKENSFTVSPLMQTENYFKTGGISQHYMNNKYLTKEFRRVFGEEEWPKIAQHQIGDLSSLPELTDREMLDAINDGIIPEAYHKEFHSKEIANLDKIINDANSTSQQVKEAKLYKQAYENSQHNIDLMRLKAGILQQWANKHYNGAAKVVVAPVMGRTPIKKKQFYTDKNGYARIKDVETLSGEHLLGYNFKLDFGDSNLQDYIEDFQKTFVLKDGTGVRKFYCIPSMIFDIKAEQHHYVPHSQELIEAYNKAKRKAKAEGRNSVSIKEIRDEWESGKPEDFYSQFMLLTKPEHVGKDGIHSLDTESLTDLARLKSLGYSDLWADYSDTQNWYDKVMLARRATLTSKGDFDRVRNLVQQFNNTNVSASEQIKWKKLEKFAKQADLSNARIKELDKIYDLVKEDFGQALSYESINDLIDNYGFKNTIKKLQELKSVNYSNRSKLAEELFPDLKEISQETKNKLKI